MLIPKALSSFRPRTLNKSLLLAHATLAIIALILTVRPAYADVITIMADDNRKEQHKDAIGVGAIADANFMDETAFSSRGFEGGSLIKNASKFTLTELHIRLTSNDTFSDLSSGGTGFSKVTLSADKKQIWFTGGAFKPGEFIWMKIPKSADFTGGVGKYRGIATAAPEPTTMLLLGTGLSGVAIKMRMRLKTRKRAHRSQ